MKIFKDNSNREWKIAVTVTAIKRVKDLLKVDLLEVLNGKLIEDLSNNPVLLCDILYVVCKDQADAANISDVDFGSSLGGDSLEFATTAFLEEMVSFFPSAKRDPLKKVLAKIKKVEQKAAEMIDAKMDSEEFNREIDDRLRSILNGSTNSAE